MKKWTSLLLALAMASPWPPAAILELKRTPRSRRHPSAAPQQKKHLLPQTRKRPQKNRPRSRRRNLPRVKHPLQEIPVPC